MIDPSKGQISQELLSAEAMDVQRDHILQKMGASFNQVVEEVGTLLQQQPDFTPYAFDIALHMEEHGGKEAADKLRNVAITVFKVSTPSPAVDDPHFITPPLTGKYPVGITSLYVEDTSRTENEIHLGDAENRTRRLELNILYPAVQSKEPRYRTLPDVEWVVDADDKRKMKFDQCWTRSQPGLEPATEMKFPLIIFSPGWAQNPNDYQLVAEELASHGYCVISVNHPGSSFVTFHLGHKQDLRMLDTMPKLGEEERAKVIEKEVTNNSNDIAFILDQIKGKNVEAFELLLGDRIDLESVGGGGHSLGGAAALETCRKLPWIKAGISLDGTMLQNPEDEEMEQPFEIIVAQADTDKPKTFKERCSLFCSRQPLASIVEIPHAEHEDFSMMPLYASLYDDKEVKEHFTEVTSAINSEILRFFTAHLAI